MASVPNIGQAIRNIRRAREIITVFASYGFRDVIQDVGLDTLFHRGKRLVGLARPDERVVREPQAVRLRKAMESLGPTFVKMAQVLSTRPDLIPEDWAKEFGRLQSGVESEPAEEMRRHIEALYDEPIDERFSEVEFEPMAAASVAQAHRAVLKDGTPVILKVLRPGIRDVIESDIEILRALANFLEDRFGEMGYSPKEVVEQFEHQIRRETDLQLEMRNIVRMASAFADEPAVKIPRCFAEHTLSSVLCLERIDGVLLSHREEGTFTDKERREIVSICTAAVFRQCFEFGYFHADPHPGNMIVVREDALAKSGDDETHAEPPLRVCFIDFGMVGHIDPRTAERLADLVHGTINGELDRVIEVVVDLTGMSPRDASSRAFRSDTWEFISRFQTASLQDLQMGHLLDEFFGKLRRHRLRCPADLVYLIKAVTTIEGVGEAIDPGFDVVGHVRPHIERLLRRRYGIGALRRRFRSSLAAYADLAEQAPRALGDVVQLLRQEQLAVNLQHRGLDDLTNEIERASRNISYALVIASLLVGGSILFLADRAAGESGGLLFWAGVVAIVIAALTGLVRVFYPRG